MADINFAIVMSWPVTFGKVDVLKNFPKLDSLKKRVESLPRIAEWIQKRPVTDR